MGNITKADRASRLQELEYVIEKSAQAFWDMAQALREIREDGLYKESHGTWENYLGDRWGFSKAWASDLMNAARVVEQLEKVKALRPLPTHVTQAVRLSSAAEEDRPEVWTRAVEEAEKAGKKTPSERDVRRAVVAHKKSKANGRPEPRPDLAHDAAKNMRHSAEAFVTSVERLVPYLADLPDDEARSCSYKVAETVHAALAVLRDAGVLDSSVMRGLLDVPSEGREILV